MKIAEFCVAGKLIRRSFKTGGLSIAKLRLGYFDKPKRQRATSTDAAARSKVSVADGKDLTESSRFCCASANLL